MTQLLEDLKNLDKLFTDEFDWCKHTREKYILGRHSYCLRGGIYKIVTGISEGEPFYLEHRKRVKDIETSIRNNLDRGFQSYMAYNDDQITTFEDIKDLIKRVIEKEENNATAQEATK